MTSVRIIAPDRRLDTTIDLEAYELDSILEILDSAEARIKREQDRLLREARIRAEADAERLIRDLNNLFSPFNSASSTFTNWAEGLRNAGSAFSSSSPFARRTTDQPGIANRPRTPHTTTEALAAVKHYAGDLGHGYADLRKAVRRAKREAHPDTGGTAADFQLVTAAEDILRRAGRI